MMSLSTRSHEAFDSTKEPRAKRVRRLSGRSLVAGLLSATVFFAFASTSAYGASVVPTLGAAAPYAILGASAGTSVGLSTITGDLGFSSTASTAATAESASSSLGGSGLLSGVGGLLGSAFGFVSGSTSVGSPAVAAAESAASAAYQAAAGEAPTQKILGGTLNGVVLTPGVYSVSGALTLVGRIELDARGDRSGHFIFQIPSDLTTAPGAELVLGGGASADNVLWQVGGATNLSSRTSFLGTILSDKSISLGPDSTLVGRALSLTGAVNLDRDSVGLPVVRAVAATAGNVVSSVAKAVTPAVRTGAPHAVAGAVPSLSATAHVSLPLPYIPLGAISVPELAVPSLPASGASTSGTGPTAALPSLLPLPLMGENVGLPSLGALSLPATGVAAPGSGATSPSRGFTAPIVGIPSLPFLGVPTLPASPGVAEPTVGVPTVGVPTVTIPGASTTEPSTTRPSNAAIPNVDLPLPLSGISLPALTSPSSLPSVSLPDLGALSNSPSSSAPASSALPLPLSGTSLPRLAVPSTSSTPAEISLPAEALPSLSPSSISLPRVSGSSSGSGSLVHPRVKEGATSSHASSAAHAKKGSASTTASGNSEIPSGAPQTGFGGMAGSGMLRLCAGLGALLVGASAGGFAVRTRRLRHG